MDTLKRPMPSPRLISTAHAVFQTAHDIPAARRRTTNVRFSASNIYRHERSHVFTIAAARASFALPLLLPSTANTRRYFQEVINEEAASHHLMPLPDAQSMLQLHNAASLPGIFQLRTFTSRPYAQQMNSSETECFAPPAFER